MTNLSLGSALLLVVDLDALESQETP
jgi:hypothetical protein